MSKIPTIQKGVYRHSKSGKLYEVLGVALNTETEEYVVVYRPSYPSEYELFVRPYAMFVESTEIDGQIVPRFECIS